MPKPDGQGSVGDRNVSTSTARADRKSRWTRPTRMPQILPRLTSTGTVRSQAKVAPLAEQAPEKPSPTTRQSRKSNVWLHILSAESPRRPSRERVQPRSGLVQFGGGLRETSFLQPAKPGAGRL